jgi:hypothetical protein
MVLKSIGVLSCGKLMGTMYACLGLIFGAFMSLISLIGVAAAPGGPGNENAIGAAFVGVGAIIFLPIFYGVMGFIGGIISAAIYNVIAGFIGGIELELQPMPPQM